MTQERASAKGEVAKPPDQKRLSESHYGLLGLHPSASAREIRQAYRDLSKLYHPDTTMLPTAIATTKFQQLNEAYATLSSPERRSAYDRKIGYSSVAVVQPLPSLQRSNVRQPSYSSSAYLDPTDRPLSPGEIFALFILGVTFLGCLCLAIAIGLTRGAEVFPATAQTVPDSPVVMSKVVPVIPQQVVPVIPKQLESPALPRVPLAPVPPAVPVSHPTSDSHPTIVSHPTVLPAAPVIPVTPLVTSIPVPSGDAQPPSESQLTSKITDSTNVSSSSNHPPVQPPPARN